MAYKQILTLILICISVLYYNCIEGTKFVEVEGEQAEAKVCRILIFELANLSCTKCVHLLM